MFSGIVQEVGSVFEIRPAENGGIRLVINCSRALLESGLGDSVAVNGTCLTIVEKLSDSLGFDVVSETLRCTNLGVLNVASIVNLEPSLKLGDRLHGHFVSGHVDGTARVISREAEGEGAKFSVELPARLKPFVAPKGSITVSGVSLTVGEVGGDSFNVYLIPHTLNETNLGKLQPGSIVNLEVDLIARYVANTLSNQGPK